MRNTLLSLAAVAALCGCGNTLGEQGLLGGGAGALGGAVLMGAPVFGALVGAGGNMLYCQQNPGACRR
jgi:osmotically inducible lipoprotein OsmB